MIKLISETIDKFFNDLKAESIKVDEDFDNEFGMQFELGIRLRNALAQNGFAAQGYKVYFEKNIKNICRKNKCTYNNHTLKKEIDLLIAKTSLGQLEDLYAIELKFPRNGQYPKQMYEFVKDLAFIAQLKEPQLKEQYNFKGCWSIVLVDDDKFYKSPKPGTIKGIYAHFRTFDNNGNIIKPQQIENRIDNPIKYDPAKKNCLPFIDIPAGYEQTVQWKSINQINKKDLYYYIVQV